MARRNKKEAEPVLKDRAYYIGLMHQMGLIDQPGPLTEPVADPHPDNDDEEDDDDSENWDDEEEKEKEDEDTRSDELYARLLCYVIDVLDQDFPRALVQMTAESKEPAAKELTVWLKKYKLAAAEHAAKMEEQARQDALIDSALKLLSKEQRKALAQLGAKNLHQRMTRPILGKK